MKRLKFEIVDNEWEPNWVSIDIDNKNDFVYGPYMETIKKYNACWLLFLSLLNIMESVENNEYKA